MAISQGDYSTKTWPKSTFVYLMSICVFVPSPPYTIYFIHLWHNIACLCWKYC